MAGAEPQPKTARGVVRCWVEGNIACGKSLLLRNLDAVLGKRAPNPGLGVPLRVCVLPEPLEEHDWDVLLARFYADPRRWALALQLKVWSSLRRRELQWRQQEEDLLLRERETLSAVVFERSPASSRDVFGRLLASRGELDPEEYRVYREVCSSNNNAAVATGRKGVVLFIDTPAEECARRVILRRRTAEVAQQRGRGGGRGGVSLDYLRDLEDMYEVWLAGLQQPKEQEQFVVWRLDGTLPPELLVEAAIAALRAAAATAGATEEDEKCPSGSASTGTTTRDPRPPGQQQQVSKG
jgi:deoxyadenosine/deoxycytidine kinase